MLNLLTFVLAPPTSYLVIAQQNETYKDFTKEYLTYPFSDLVPPNTKIYPHFRFNRFTDKGVAKSRKVVELENDRIKVQIRPDIGDLNIQVSEEALSVKLIHVAHA